MQIQELKKTLDSDSGKVMKEYLMGKLNELRMIDSIKILDTPTHQTIELKAQKKAFEKLREILNDLITIEDSDVSPSEPNPYGPM
jgi:hypothetical protein